MKKLSFSILLVLTLALAMPISSYATNKDFEAIGNSMKNIVENAGNAVEDGAKNASDRSKEATNAVEDAAGKAGDNMKKGMEDVKNNVQGTAESMKNGVEYTAQKTAAETENMSNNLMNPTTWAWIVIGVLVVAIVAIFWYFMAQSKK